MKSLALAAAGISDADKRKLPALVAMGHWGKVYEMLGPRAMYAYLLRIPGGPPWREGVKVLQRRYFDLAKRKWGAPGLIQFEDPEGVSIGRESSWVNGWIWVSEEELTKEVTSDEPRFHNYAHAAMVLWDGPGVRFMDDPNVTQGSSPGSFVQASFEVEADELQGHWNRGKRR
jgi:hypothetical protein